MCMYSEVSPVSSLRSENTCCCRGGPLTLLIRWSGPFGSVVVLRVPWFEDIHGFGGVAWLSVPHSVLMRRRGWREVGMLCMPVEVVGSIVGRRQSLIKKLFFLIWRIVM